MSAEEVTVALVVGSEDGWAWASLYQHALTREALRRIREDAEAYGRAVRR